MYAALALVNDRIPHVKGNTTLAAELQSVAISLRNNSNSHRCNFIRDLVLVSDNADSIANELAMIL